MTSMIQPEKDLVKLPMFFNVVRKDYLALGFGPRFFTS